MFALSDALALKKSVVRLISLNRSTVEKTLEGAEQNRLI